MKKTARLAEDTGATPSQIRFYVRERLLHPKETTPGGLFLFDDSGEERLRRILELRDDGLGLPEIRERLREETKMLPAEDVREFWGLDEDPFSDSAPIKYFYKSRQHVEAIERIFDGIVNRKLNITQITGEVGTGKTFTSQIIKYYLEDEGFATVFVERPYENWPSLLDFIVERLDASIDTEGKIEKSEKAFRHILETYRNEKKRLLIILDDIQIYNDETLEKVIRLTNINDADHSYISLLLVGQPNARERLAQIKAIFSRIKVKQYFNNMMEEDLVKYIAFRMLVAGHKPDGESMEGSQFMDMKKKDEWEAVARTTPFYKFRSQLYVATGGMPRMVNLACTRLLELAAERGELEISPDTFTRVSAELELGLQDGRLAASGA